MRLLTIHMFGIHSVFGATYLNFVYLLLLVCVKSRMTNQITNNPSNPSPGLNDGQSDKFAKLNELIAHISPTSVSVFVSISRFR